ncbi:PREDICTED: uncharacterized protein LOC107172419 [Diuraphis noxia]|uniref:uncharacterized protein LOC107172419 n=1 Tax=Diuraphis noxia TaxID=143948 RepID=UPI0007636A27|nr:PREDICTED: uncharacterized protein LOC107172419 [Diuraphis noxia]
MAGQYTSHREAFVSGLSTGAPNPTAKGSADYHEEINGDVFLDWLKGVIPLLKDNSVIVMDNAPYHSVKCEKCPTLDWKKAEIENWMEEKGEQFDRPMNKIRLMDIVKRIKPRFNTYVMTVLRTLLYHCECNPIKLAWSSVKRYVKTNNTTFKLPDIKKLLIEGVKSEMWKNFVHHVIKVENRFWKVDLTIDDVMDDDNLHVMTIGDTLDSDDLRK